MRFLGAWSGRLAMAGACLAWAGCGGGGVPDPDSDTSAIVEPPSNAVAQRGPQAAPEAPAAAEPAPEAPAPAPAPAPAVASNPPTAEVEKPAAPAAEAPALKGDASGTEEMLRIGATAAPTAVEPAPSATPAAGVPGAPVASTPAGMPAMPGGASGAMSPGMAAMAGGGTLNSPAATTPGATTPNDRITGSSNASPEPVSNAAAATGIAPTMTSNANPAVPAGMPGGLAPAGMREAGGPGGFGGPPGGTDPNGETPTGPASFRFPQTAVTAFLSALTARDKDRLAQATARRAPTEAIEKHKKIFAAIVDQSISDDELDEMAKAMTGYQVIQILQAQSTGKIGVVIAKMDGRDRLQRTLTLRKEKEGWKVMDISQLYDFKPSVMPVMPGRGRRR